MPHNFNYNEYSFDFALTQLESAVSGNQEFKKELAADFLQELANTETQIEAYLADEDWVSLKRLFHTIKPNATLFGSASFSALCLSLEGYCLEEEKSEIEPVLEIFFSQLTRFREDLISALK